MTTAARPVLLAAILVSTLMEGATMAGACASGHIKFSLIGLDPASSVARPFSAVAEPGSGTSSKPFTIRAAGDGCNDNVSVPYSAVQGTATHPADFDQTSGSFATFFPAGDHAPKTASVGVPIKADSAIEPAAERVDVGLGQPSGGALSRPSSAGMYIVDVDGSSRVAFDGGPSSVSETDGVIHVPVFRAGPAGGAASVQYTLAGGGGDPAEAGDFSDLGSGSLSFGSSDRWEVLRISVANDAEPEAAEGITISLGTASGASVVSPSTAEVVILDNEEALTPISRLHHPRHGWKYRRTDYRLREIHVFTTDQGGSTVVAAELGLRQNLRNGRCRWWAGRRFRAGECRERRWLDLPLYETDFFYYRIPGLRESMGTRVKDYTAFSRAVDGAGNVESSFEEKRNANTFEVKKGKRRRK